MNNKTVMVCVCLGLLAAACRGGPDDAGVSGLQATTGEGACPTPGKLPFKTQSSAFETDEAKDLVKDYPRPVYESDDVLGNPGTPQVIGGAMKRAQDVYLSQTAVADEFVSLWTSDGTTSWRQLDRAKTDGGAKFSFDVTSKTGFTSGAHSVFSVLEGDGSCAVHGVFLWPPGTQVVVTDIDGTLTLDDSQFTKQVGGEPDYDPLLNASADEVMKTWGNKGYKVIYLSARPSSLRGPTRVWLHEKGVPFGPLITASSFVLGNSAREYKRGHMQEIITTFGWKVVAAYGNANSDYQAYEDAGIPKQITFIVGPLAGESNTVPIANNNFGDHLTNFVDKQPDAQQP